MTEKEKQIYELVTKATKLAKECLKISSKPLSKYSKVNLNRAIKIISYSIAIRQYFVQLQIIQSKPLPKGGVSEKYEKDYYKLRDRKGKEIAAEMFKK